MYLLGSWSCPSLCFYLPVARLFLLQCNQTLNPLISKILVLTILVLLCLHSLTAVHVHMKFMNLLFLGIMHFVLHCKDISMIQGAGHFLRILVLQVRIPVVYTLQEYVQSFPIFGFVFHLLADL